MNALNQYIDLYLQHRRLVDDNSAKPLNALRDKALHSLEKNLLPTLGSENYERTDLNALLAPDYGLNIARIPMDVNPTESFRCGVPNLSTNLFFLINDTWGESANARNNLPDGVEIGSLCRMGREMPEVVAGYYGGIADINNPLVALNTMLVQDGLWLRIKRGTHLDRPLQLVNILSSTMPLMCVRRLLIIAEDDTDAKLLICDHTQNPDTAMLSLQTVEIYAGENSRFDYYDLEETTENTTRLCSLYLQQERGSNVMVDGITLFNGHTRNEYFCTFHGSAAELKLYGMGIEDSRRTLDTHSLIKHNTTDCHTDELFKYVVDDQATGAFTGRIYVAPGACRTEAYQANRNLVGSDKADMYSKPQLEIYNDDVKCSHGTAIGQLDAMQLFYMRTRGLDEAQARLLLKQAFMADVIDGVRLPILRDRLQLLTERRFAGELTSCADCQGCR